MKSVTFFHITVPLFSHNDDPIVALKPIAEGLGLNWQEQFDRLERANRFTTFAIPVESHSGREDFLCIPLAQLNDWLYATRAHDHELDLSLFRSQLTALLYLHWTDDVTEV